MTPGITRTPSRSTRPKPPTLTATDLATTPWNGRRQVPEDATQWSDIDGDGYGDNAEGTTPDAFIADPTQWSDVDGDGYGDNPTGRLADAFPDDPTQWEDLDGDGFGDNLSGNNPDPYLFDLDNDGYNDSIDPLQSRLSRRPGQRWGAR